MKRNFARCAIVVATGMVGNAMPAIAQVKASEISTMSQVIDGTTITMQYSRPRVRGRDPLFGTEVVHWGEVWTPGANWATTLETDKAITLDGHAVRKGKYSVWFVVRQSGDWTMVLDPKWKIFHHRPRIRMVRRSALRCVRAKPHSLMSSPGRCPPSAWMAARWQ